MFYPVFLDLRGKNCVVVGGGSVALRKVQALVAAGARVVVVSPSLELSLQRLVDGNQVAWQEREFVPADLEGAFLVIAATGDPGVNEQVWLHASQSGLLVNVVDDPARCNFIVPAVVRRGSLAIAVSTEGKSPALARKVRERLEGIFGEEYGPFLDFLGEFRGKVLRLIPEEERRRRLFYRLAGEDFQALIREGALEEARARAEALLTDLLGGVSERDGGMDDQQVADRNQGK